MGHRSGEMDKRNISLMVKKILLLKCCLFYMFIYSSGQKYLGDVIEEYYKVNPYAHEFSSFLKEIFSDTSLIKDEMYKRTDSTFFYLHAHYKGFNPFHFTAQRTEMILAETEIAYSDSLHTLDTLIIYQIIGCTDSSEKQKTLVKKEFLRFGKKYETVFRSSTFQEYKNNSSDGQIKNYFVDFSSISPLSIAWAKLPEEYKCVFTITLRIKVRENRAELPESPDDF
jgi:hypothetical protein